MLSFLNVFESYAVAVHLPRKLESALPVHLKGAFSAHPIFLRGSSINSFPALYKCFPAHNPAQTVSAAPTHGAAIIPAAVLSPPTTP